ncbi:MAG: tRNA dihydrouridine synthase DusB [Candidatus Omnitrophica bacterium]|nr:tRNA dihydrouridine synthase DusB [Candidatus Omnitrophota bacterium]
MLKIGSVSLKSNLILAPLAGISDLPYRMLNRRFGAELAFIEMLNCRSLSHKSRRTKEMLATNPDDRPLGIQILGCEPRFILKALDVLRTYEFEVLDFNAACPAKKVVRRGEGAGLLKDPKKLKKLLELVVGNTKVPVTVKIRLGWDKDSVNAREVALLAEDAGVAGIFVHGRTKMQGYSGRVDYTHIAGVKKAVRIPVIASGDIMSAELAVKMRKETGCDGLAIARGGLGNPWIFKEIQSLLRGEPVPARPSKEDIMKVMLEHLIACDRYYGERIGVIRFRKFFSWYTRGFRKVRSLREKSSQAKTEEQMCRIIEESRGSY